MTLSEHFYSHGHHELQDVSIQLRDKVNSKDDQGPVARSLVSVNRWLRGIKTYGFPWHLTLVSANHALSNPGLLDKEEKCPEYFVVLC